MKTMSLSQAVGPLRDYARAHATEPLILTARGKPVAALIHLANTDWESIRLSMNPKFMSLIDHSRRRAEREGTISLGLIKRELGIPPKPAIRKKRP